MNVNGLWNSLWNWGGIVEQDNSPRQIISNLGAYNKTSNLINRHWKKQLDFQRYLVVIRSCRIQGPCCCPDSENQFVFNLVPKYECKWSQTLTLSHFHHTTAPTPPELCSTTVITGPMIKECSSLILYFSMVANRSLSWHPALLLFVLRKHSQLILNCSLAGEMHLQTTHTFIFSTPAIL